jgi:hypothetical protein
MIYCVRAYRENGIWFFDDEGKGIFKEPFVGGMSEIIDYILQKKFIRGGHRGIKLEFSDKSFENAEKLQKIEDLPDNWAKYEYEDREGMLCPVALQYFQEFPQEIFIKFTKIPFFMDFQIVDSDFCKP